MQDTSQDSKQAETVTEGKPAPVPFKPNRKQKRQILGALRRAKRQAKRKRVRALARGHGKTYDAIVEAFKVKEAAKAEVAAP